MSGSYVRIFESQLEEICVPLAVTRLTTSEAGSVITQIWFDTDVTPSDLEAAIDKLGRRTTISESLQLAHNNIERALI